jgi:hypothetical protein
MKILVKFPTRSRPEQFLSTLKGYIDNTDDVASVDYLITIDSNDATMDADVLKRINAMTNRATINHGSSVNKIHAVNRGMEQYKTHWDILVLASDDMICQKKGWDTIIKSTMEAYYPDTDGALWFWDGDHNTRRNGLCTMNIMGRKYYDRFGYIYHPSYSSLWCDNEFTDVGLRLGKLKFFDQVLFKHVHFSNTPGLKPDELMKLTQSYFGKDQENYRKRLSINFNLDAVHS